MDVFINFDDIDRHGDGCDCGNCDSNSKSYGVGIYSISGEIIDRIYRCSEYAALEAAEKMCLFNDYRIIDRCD